MHKYLRNEVRLSEGLAIWVSIVDVAGQRDTDSIVRWRLVVDLRIKNDSLSCQLMTITLPTGRTIVLLVVDSSRKLIASLLPRGQPAVP